MTLVCCYLKKNSYFRVTRWRKKRLFKTWSLITESLEAAGCKRTSLLLCEQYSSEDCAIPPASQNVIFRFFVLLTTNLSLTVNQKPLLHSSSKTLWGLGVTKSLNSKDFLKPEKWAPILNQLWLCTFSQIVKSISKSILLVVLNV